MEVVKEEVMHEIIRDQSGREKCVKMTYIWLSAAAVTLYRTVHGSNMPI